MNYRRTRNKYGVDVSEDGKLKRTMDGILFSSQKECKRYSELAILQRAGVISNLELQKPFELRVNGVLICKYIADFVYKDQQGREVVEDSKGFKTRDYILKSKLMIACHGLRVIEV